MSRQLTMLCVCVCILLVALHAGCKQQPAELVILNGKLWVPGVEGSNGSSRTAVAVRGGKIVRLGSDDEIRGLIAPSTKVLDAHRATVTPGLHDAHVHFLSGSLSLSQADLSPAVSLEDVKRIIREFVAAHPSQSVIVGRGWVYGSFEGGLPTREQLDELVPDRPAVMRCYDGHTVWVNSRALATAEITRETADPDGGVIVRDAQGEPTGVFKESAQNLVDKVVPEPTKAEKLEALRDGIRHAHGFGVTSVCEAGVGLAELDLFETLRASQELDLRMAIALEGRKGMIDSDFDALDQLKKRFSQLSIGTIKLYADGVVESHTAALLSPYTNRPDSQGSPSTTPEDLSRIVAELDRRGWQIMVHAIGDGGIRMTLDAFEHAQIEQAQIEQAQNKNARPAGGRRHRLEHIESISQTDIDRLGKLGILASMQPYHANPNGNIFNVWAVNLGPERASRAWIWKSLQDRGARLAFGSDWPVVSIDPRLGMHVALTRQTLDGQPPGGFLPEQRLDLANVLDAYTKSAAYAQFAEDSQGSIQVGQYADLVIWDQDLFAVPIDKVHECEVQTTIFNGEVVYMRSAH